MWTVRVSWNNGHSYEDFDGVPGANVAEALENASADAGLDSVDEGSILIDISGEGDGLVDIPAGSTPKTKKPKRKKV